MAIDWNRQRGELLDILAAGSFPEGNAWVRQVISEGARPMEVFDLCIGPALEEVGRRFQTLEIFLPELMLAAEVIQAITDDVLVPAMKAVQESRPISAKVMIGTVQGDIHDIGKNMVILLLQLNGFNVIDLGVDVRAVDFVERARAEKADIIALSAIITTGLPHMASVLNLLEGFGCREQFKVVIGGAATTPSLAKEIGADAYGRDATQAVDICRQLSQSQVAA